MLTEKAQELIEDVIIFSRHVGVLSTNGTGDQFRNALAALEKKQKSLSDYIGYLENK